MSFPSRPLLTASVMNSWEELIWLKTHHFFFLAGRDFYWISTSSCVQIVCQSMCASVGEAREGAVGHTKDGSTPALFLCCWKRLAAAAYWCYAGAAKWPDSSALTGTQQQSHTPSRLTLKALVSLAGGRWLAWRCVAASPGAAGPTSLGQTHRCIRWGETETYSLMRSLVGLSRIYGCFVGQEQIASWSR